MTLDAPVSVPSSTDFTVSVDVSQVSKLNAANFRFAFDSSLITLNNVTNGTIGTTTIKVDGYQEVQPGICNVVIFLGGIKEATGSGTLAVIHFHALSKAGVTDIYLSEGVLSDSSAHEIEATWNGSTVTVEVATPSTTQPATGGGGGGGGSGSSSSNGKTIVSLRGSSSSEGVAWEDIRAISMDTKCTLDIPRGTKCTNANGYALSSISLTQITSPDAAQKGVTIIGTVYELGPSGASFDPPITLTIKYDESGLPAGTDESALTIAVWDAASNSYKNIDCQVDTQANTITALISHFSRYAIIAVPVAAPSPAVTSTITTTTKPPSVPASTSTPTSSPVQSPTPKPVATQPSSTPVISPPAPQTTTPVAALPVEKSGKNWWLYGGIFGAVVVIGLLLFVYITRRRD